MGRLGMADEDAHQELMKETVERIRKRQGVCKWKKTESG